MLTSKYIIGLGTGRCGTASLAHLLNAQPGLSVGHEAAPLIPWQSPAQTDALGWLTAHEKGFGDVAHSWIGLVPQLARDACVRCVALWRPVEATVDSFCRAMPTEYIQTDGPHGAPQFPTYDLPEQVAWRRYVEVYHMQLRGLAMDGYVTLLRMDRLNTEAGQRRILSAAGVSTEDQVLLTDCHRNAN